MPNAKVKAKDSTLPFRYFASHPWRWVAKVRIPFSLWFYLPNLLVMDAVICINLLNRLTAVHLRDIWYFSKGPKSMEIHSHPLRYIGIDWIGSLSYRSGSICCVWPRTARTTRCELCIRSISAEAKELLFVLRWKCANVPVILLNLMVERTVSFKVVCWLQLQRLSLICQIEVVWALTVVAQEAKLAQLFAIKLWWRKLIRLTNFQECFFGGKTVSTCLFSCRFVSIFQMFFKHSIRTRLL